jgi:hypothetical protein
MAQDLTVNIKTTSEVPQAMEKAKAATVSFSKQVEDIRKKFSTAFKDVFLGFTAPMVLIQGAISMISSAIAKAKQDAQDGLDLVAKGETAFASSEEKKMAAYFKAKKAREEEQRLVKEGILETSREFLKTQTGKAFQEVEARNAREAGQSNLAGLIEMGNMKMATQLDPALLGRLIDTWKRTPEGQKALGENVTNVDGPKAGTFKGPEGFGSVIGVGANPVMEAMTKQVEVLEEIKLILQESMPSGGGVPPSFTEPLNAASRVGNV